MRGFIRAILSLWLLATPATADDLAPFRACVGPELEARAKLFGYSAPCMLTDECSVDPDAEPSHWFPNVESECLADQMTICGISEDPDACLSGFSDLLSGMRADVVEALPGSGLRPPSRDRTAFGGGV